MARRITRTHKAALQRMPLLALALLIGCDFGRHAKAAILYWDTDDSTTGNDASNGANLGGSGNWSNSETNWWDANQGSPQAWTDGSDAVFWGTAGEVTVSTVSANSVALKTSGYSLNSGTVNLTGST